MQPNCSFRMNLSGSAGSSAGWLFTGLEQLRLSAQLPHPIDARFPVHLNVVGLPQGGSWLDWEFWK